MRFAVLVCFTAERFRDHVDEHEPSWRLADTLDDLIFGTGSASASRRLARARWRLCTLGWHNDPRLRRSSEMEQVSVALASCASRHRRRFVDRFRLADLARVGIGL